MIRLGAALALEDLAGPADREAMLRLSRDSDATVREVACSTLGRLGGEGVAEALVERIADDEERVRQAAVLALGRLEVDRIVPDLLRLLHEPRTMEVRRGGGVIKMENPFPAEAAAEALAHFHRDDVLDSLIAVLDDSGTHEKVRLQSIRSLGVIGDGRAVGSLAPILTDARWPIRLEAIKALQAIGGLTTIRTILGRLEEAVRQGAPPGEIEALGGALRKLTGEEFGPFPRDRREDSEEAIRLWQAWVEGESE